MNRIFFIFITSCSLLFCQFVEIECEIDHRRVPNDNKFFFDDLCNDIKQYYKSNIFSPDAQDIEIEIKINFIIEYINKAENGYNISSQILATNKMDQIYYSKSAEFPINSTKNLIFTQTYNPFTHLLDYYAFFFIAMELDTWQKMGGELYFSKALSISDYALDQSKNSGWNDRYEDVKKNKENIYFRNLRYYFFEALDEHNQEKSDLKAIKTSLESFFDNLYQISDKYGREKFCMIFLKAYASEIAMLNLTADMDESLLFLINYDSENKEIYNSSLQKIYLKAK